jgi:two-component system OmpR family response regulator
VSGGGRVLVVEDSEAIRLSVVDALVDVGYVADGRVDGAALEDVLDGFRPDLVILDVMLPGRDGFELVAVVRERTDAGIVMLTARDALTDRVRGLDGDADDYVVKPFLLAELVSRVRAVPRCRGREVGTIQLGDLVLDDDANAVSRGGKLLDLTATELRLLRYLVAQRNRREAPPGRGAVGGAPAAGGGQAGARLRRYEPVAGGPWLIPGASRGPGRATAGRWR